MLGNPGRVEHCLAGVWLLLCGLVMSNAAGGFVPVLTLAFAAVFLGAVWGLLHIENEIDGAYVVTSEGFLGWAGFAYIPHDMPAESGRRLRHLHNHWWTFRIPD